MSFKGNLEHLKVLMEAIEKKDISIWNIFNLKLSKKAKKFDYRNPEFHGANLEGIELIEVNLNGIDLRKAYLGYANLKGTNLEKADLGEAFFALAHLIGVNLRKANLTRADLRGADCSLANLVEANLTQANIYYTKFTNANLENAILHRVLPYGTDFTGAKVDKSKITYEISKKASGRYPTEEDIKEFTEQAKKYL